jgi:hypothetical protein
MRWLLYLYPRAWRRRYGEEFAALLERERPSLRLSLDVLLGALDAHWCLHTDGRPNRNGEHRMAIWARTAPLLLALAITSVVGWGISRPDLAPGSPAASVTVGQNRGVGQAGDPSAPPSRPPVLLEADLSAVPATERDARLEQVVQVAERRLRAAGVSDATIEVLDGGRLWIALPPDQDVASFMGLLTTTARLDFREQATQPDGTTAWVVARVRDAAGVERPLTGAYVHDARAVTDPNSRRPVVEFEMSAEGQDLLATLTERLLDQQLAIFVDDQLQVALTVRSPIVQGRGMISGNFTPQDARDLAIQLVSGPLPVPVQLVDPPRS